MVLLGTTYYVTGFGAAPKFSCIFRFAVLFILSVSFFVKVGDGPGKMAHLWYENQKFELTLTSKNGRKTCEMESSYASLTKIQKTSEGL